jgi:hypothetical protein
LYNGFFKFTSASSHFVLKSFSQYRISARKPPVCLVLIVSPRELNASVIFLLNRFADMEHQVQLDCHIIMEPFNDRRRRHGAQGFTAVIC